MDFAELFHSLTNLLGNAGSSLVAATQKQHKQLPTSVHSQVNFTRRFVSVAVDDDDLEFHMINGSLNTDWTA